MQDQLKFERLLNNLDCLITEEAIAITKGHLELLESLAQKKNDFILSISQEHIDPDALDVSDIISRIVSNLEYNHRALNKKLNELQKHLNSNQLMISQLKKVEASYHEKANDNSRRGSLLCSA